MWRNSFVVWIILSFCKLARPLIFSWRTLRLINYRCRSMSAKFSWILSMLFNFSDILSRNCIITWCSFQPAPWSLCLSLRPLWLFPRSIAGKTTEITETAQRSRRYTEINDTIMTYIHLIINSLFEIQRDFALIVNDC